jgi:hypothetical protein
LLCNDTNTEMILIVDLHCYVMIQIQK